MRSSTCRRFSPAALVASCLLLCSPAAAAVRMPSVFSRHMVLQRGIPVPVWGWANPGEEVTVTLAGQTRSVKAGPDRKWLVRLDKLDTGGPHTLIVKGKNTVTINDVLVGEVWFASGQSNMVNFVVSCSGYEKVKAEANLPRLRVFHVGRAPAREPQADCQGTWRPCTPELVGGFSATSFYFGLELYRKLGVPVGIINSALGSTPIEAWTSLDAQKDRRELKELLASWDRKAADYNPESAKATYEKELATWKEAVKKAKEEGKPAPREPRAPVQPRDQPQHPAVMFNGMVAPLIPYGVRGVIWYQGEYNTQTEEYAALYRQQLPLLVHDWRARWGREDLPFAWVQLPNFDTTTRTPRMTGWPLVREGQLQALSEPKTGMTVTIDIGEANGIHPRNKQDFSHRLALWARAEVYGEKVPWSGPLFVGFRATGESVDLRFRHADGLVARGGDLKGFVIAGLDRKWQPATARIEGGRVVVSAKGVKGPVAIRYSWADNPDGNLFNAAGIPASPFRTDRD